VRENERQGGAKDGIHGTGHWLALRQGDWEKLSCIGAVNTRCTGKKGTGGERRYYIGSRGLTAEELLRYARLEWTVESMHWLPDVHFGEDFCRIEDRNAQQNLNIVRKIALNTVKVYKTKRRPNVLFLKLCLIVCLNLGISDPSCRSMKIDFRGPSPPSVSQRL
jgi:predicted transposase YbfD/YdcC